MQPSTDGASRTNVHGEPVLSDNGGITHGCCLVLSSLSVVTSMLSGRLQVPDKLYSNPWPCTNHPVRYYPQAVFESRSLETPYAD